MADVTFKCPSCGGYLEYDPAAGKWKCPYCASLYNEAELLEKDKHYHESAKAEKAEGGAAVYRCASCGSEIIADETTVATRCYYCHSPVVLQGKLTDEMRPEKVLPFTVDKKKAVDEFLSWTSKKNYVPSDFFTREQVENLIQGVYFPYFVYDCELEGTLSGEASNTETHRHGDDIDTYRHIYHVERGGKLSFRNLLRPALKAIRRKITDGVQPYPLETMKDFSGAYLSGFLAERRDQEGEAYRAEIASELNGYASKLLDQDINYMQKDLHVNTSMEKFHGKYVLLPAWVLTYPNRKKPEEPFYYAMNGCTGAVCGKLPVVQKKLWLHAAAIAGGILLAGFALCFFLLNF